jgi:hypothetical protein
MTTLDEAKPNDRADPTTRVGSHQSPSGCRFTTRVRLLIMNRPAGFSAIATANTARASASVRHRSDPGPAHPANVRQVGEKS